MKLNKLQSVHVKKQKRIGRGYGSGKGGHTVGRGQKGQASRSGFKKLRAWIRETKLKSIPKLRGIGKRTARRGFYKQHSKSIVINLKDLNEFKEGSTISIPFLREKGLVTDKSKNVHVKILANGKLDKKIDVKGIRVSESAREAIEKAGGKIL
jgi:large subunit ribosomal protein L15